MSLRGLEFFLTRRDGWFFFLASRGLLNWMGDEAYLRRVFKYALGYKPDFAHPRTYNEKLNWLKLHDRRPLYTQLADKYAVRSYVAERIGAEHLVPLVGGPWNSVEEIDFGALPEQFVLKCTHDSGSVVICADKSAFDPEAAKEKLARCLRRNYYWSYREWPYKNVVPRIVAEAYLQNDDGSDLLDYKFFCFDGVPRILYISNDHGSDPHTDFFDMDFHRLPMRMKDPNTDTGYPKPPCFEALKRAAAVLSAGLPHVRVDFYCVGERFYFGEFTFYHNSGFQSITPPEWNEILGAWIRLPTDGAQE